LLESTGVSIEGQRAVVLGRSDIVGSPVAAMLRNRDATVTQCHSKTKNLPEIVRLRLAQLVRLLTTPQVKEADILVAAIGKPEFVQGSWLKPGAVVIDVGTNYIPGTVLLIYSQPFLELTAHQIQRRNRDSAWLEM
jgi:methylenetetrahydrofolate dehydrogenase (NADP+)/methenyltetrahydrofolate cyclohydrolase/formyltetrahydrofolate synthetase